MIDSIRERFGFTKMPFGRDLPAAMLHQHADCGEAAARITWTIAGRAVGIITGEVGTGKTAAVRAATAGLDPAGHTLIYIGNPATGVRGICHHIVTALGGRPAHGTAALAAQAWGVLAGEAAERGRTPVLVIDEAHLLDHQQLEALRMMTLCRPADYAALSLGWSGLRSSLEFGCPPSRHNPDAPSRLPPGATHMPILAQTAFSPVSRVPRGPLRVGAPDRYGCGSSSRCSDYADIRAAFRASASRFRPQVGIIPESA